MLSLMGCMTLKCNTRRAGPLVESVPQGVVEIGVKVPFDSDYSGEDDASTFFAFRLVALLTVMLRIWGYY